jgi:cyclopropane-fatty-acyl-phospholipid synthase
MKSKIYVGEVSHTRFAPVVHAFKFPYYCYGFDLDELPEIGRTVPWFGYNRRRLVALWDKDYLDGKPGPLRGRLLTFLRRQGFTEELGRIELVTAARYLGQVFNPVSFFYCHRPDDTLACVVAEVNNTWGERHHYLLHPLAHGPTGFAAGATHPKQFHVSPFNDRLGEYEFLFADLQQRLDIQVTLHREGQRHLWAGLTGTPQPLTAQNLRQTLRQFPLTPLKTMPRILWQAVQLRYGKKLPLYRKPAPSSPQTIPAGPTWLQKRARPLVLGFMAKIKTGTLTVRLPDGTVHELGCAGTLPQAQLVVQDHAFFERVLKAGDIGFGEAYMFDEWDTDDLTALLSVFAKNLAVADDRRIVLSWVGRLFNRLRHALRSNTLLGSRKNIREHYDLSNDFFKLFLDETMMYSCALYAGPEQSAVDAQRNKLQAIIRKAHITASDHVLEIGSGWGGFALEAARTTGCRVTSITLSEEQLKFARDRARAAGLADRVHFEFCDYRQAVGTYDKIVSIEMLEAVGHEHFGTFFAACERLLKPDGCVVLQVITIPDQRYEAYRFSSDWIQKHIFPGGMLPSLTALSRAMTRHSHLVVDKLDNIGPHYARTLREWRERFIANLPAIEKLGFDRVFQRKWIYYFCYCEAGFATRALNNLQLVLTRPGNQQMDSTDPAA